MARRYPPNPPILRTHPDHPEHGLRMTDPQPARITPSHVRTFGPDSSLDVESSPALHQGSPAFNDHRRLSGRVSFSHSIPRRSMLHLRGHADDDEFASEGPQDKPAIPSALQGPREEYATPLPVLSMIVLSIVRVLSLIAY